MDGISAVTARIGEIRALLHPAPAVPPRAAAPAASSLPSADGAGAFTAGPSFADALARAGADVELLTSEFLYGPVPAPVDYRVTKCFYRHSTKAGVDHRGRLPVKALEHIPDMLAVRDRLEAADVEHWQWTTMPRLDRRQPLVGLALLGPQVVFALVGPQRCGALGLCGDAQRRVHPEVG